MLIVGASASTALAGVVFNALLITRAPLQLFQSVQTSLLPHLSGLEATEGSAAFARAIRVTVLAIAAFAGAVALGLLLIGPWVMDLVFGAGYDYGARRPGRDRGRHGPAPVRRHAQPGRARARPGAGRRGRRWLAAAAAFVAWMVSPVVEDQLLRAEIGYAGAAGLLCAVPVAALYGRRG